MPTENETTTDTAHKIRIIQVTSADRLRLKIPRGQYREMERQNGGDKIYTRWSCNKPEIAELRVQKDDWGNESICEVIPKDKLAVDEELTISATLIYGYSSHNSATAAIFVKIAASMEPTFEFAVEMVECYGAYQPYRRAD
jgi:hypothetical protein